MSKLHHNPQAQRDGKWRVSYEEYSETHRPDFFSSGAGFVISYRGLCISDIETLAPK